MVKIRVKIAPQQEQKKQKSSPDEDSANAVQKMSGPTRLVHPLMFLKYIVGTLCAAMLVIVFRHCYERYSSYETKANLGVRPTGDATFVAMTVCPSFDVGYKNDVLTRFGSNKGRYQNGDFSSTSALGAREFYAEVAFDLAEMLDSVQVHTASQEKTTFEVSLTDFNSSLALWTRKPYHLYGDCFELRLKSALSDLTVTEVVFTSNIAVYIFFHFPGQYLAVDSMTKIPSEVGNMTWVDVSYDISIDTLADESEYPCQPVTADSVSLDDCLYRAITAHMTDQIGCSLPYLPQFDDDEVVCDSRNEELMSKAFEMYDGLISYRHDQFCPKPCSVLASYVNSPTSRILPEKDRDKAKSIISFKSTVKVSRTVLAYTLASALAEVGQYTGLLLGVSLVRVAAGMLEMVAEEAKERGGAWCCGKK